MSTAPNPFTQQENPYAAPSQPAYPMQQPGNIQGGVWRRGDLLVMHKQATLPDRCVKTNAPTTRKLKRSLSWHHPALFLVLIISWPIYLILALVLRKTAKIYIGVTDKVANRRKRNMLIAWLLVLASFVSLATGIALSGPTNDSAAVIGIILFPILLLTGALWGLYGCRVVHPKRIDDQYVYLKGVCPEYLRQFPEC